MFLKLVRWGWDFYGNTAHSGIAQEVGERGTRKGKKQFKYPSSLSLSDRGISDVPFDDRPESLVFVFIIIFFFWPVEQKKCD